MPLSPRREGSTTLKHFTRHGISRHTNLPLGHWNSPWNLPGNTPWSLAVTGSESDLPILLQSPSMYTSSMNGILDVRIDRNEPIPQIWVLSDDDIRVPGHRHKDRIDTTANGCQENLAHL